MLADSLANGHPQSDRVAAQRSKNCDAFKSGNAGPCHLGDALEAKFEVSHISYLAQEFPNVKRFL